MGTCASNEKQRIGSRERSRSIKSRIKKRPLKINKELLEKFQNAAKEVGHNQLLEHQETKKFISWKNRVGKNSPNGSNIKYFDHSRMFKVVVNHSEDDEINYKNISKDILAAYPRAEIVHFPVKW